MKKNVIKWIVSVFFILFGLACIGGSIVSGLLFFIGSILINPIFHGYFEKKGKKIKKRIYVPMILVLFFAGVMTSNTSTSPKNTMETANETEIEQAESDSVEKSNIADDVVTVTSDETEGTRSEFSMHFIDVGQGDATLIKCDGEAMLVDAGDINKGTTVQLYLTKQNVSELKYVVGTHPDADHIGGMDVILTKYNCGTVFMPDRISNSKSYQEVLDAMEYKNYKVTVPKAGDTFNLGSATCTVLGPIETNMDDNNTSIVLKIQYGNTSFILSGDAETNEENDIISSGADINADVYHAGHHGSKSSSSSEWMKLISPDAVVISCGNDNSYGHPHAETLALYKQMGIAVYRTDEQGNIVVTSDGEKLTWSNRPSDTWKAGEELQQEETEQLSQEDSETHIEDGVEEVVSDQTAYVLNTNTKKFHYPYCSSASDIKPENKKEVNGTRDEIMNMGYDACKRCNP